MKDGWIMVASLWSLLGSLVGLTAYGAPISHGVTILPGIPEESPSFSAYQAFREGRFSDALELYQTLAEAGDAEANFLMAFAAEARVEVGSLGASRMQAMSRHYGKAVQEGHPEARLRLMLMEMIAGNEQQRAQARKDLEAAANEDRNSRAWRVYGEAWLNGAVSGEPDPDKAILWWTKAAEAGDEVVLVPLGALFLREGRSSGEIVAGRRWLEKAIQSANPDASVVLGDFEARTLKNPVAAEREYRRGAEGGQAECMLRLSDLLEITGKSDESRSWLEKSAAAGNPEARYSFARRILTEDENQVNAAYPFLLAAANDGVWQAQYEVAMILLEGRLGYKDSVSAGAWLTKAATSGDPETQYQLGLLHEWGFTGSVNYSNVGILYTLACQGGHAKAAGRLARMAYDGIRVRSNPVQAWAYSKIALERGDDSTKPLFMDLDGKLNDVEKKEASELFARIQSEKRVPPERVK